MDALKGFLEPTNLISLLFVSVILFLGGYLMHRTMKKEGLTITEYFNQKIIMQHMGLVLLFIFFSALSESIIASTIPHPNEFMNPVGRFLAHFSMNMVAVILLISLPQAIVDFFKTIQDISKGKAGASAPAILILSLLKTIFMGYTAFMIPYWNLKIIAQGLHQLHLVELGFRHLFPFIDTQGYYVSIGLPADFDPFKKMTNQVYASTVLVAIHYVLAIIDGLHATLEGLKGESIRTAYKVSKKVRVKGEPEREKRIRERERERDRDSGEHMIRELRELIEYVNTDLTSQSVEDYLDEVAEDLTELSSQEVIDIGVSLRDLYKRYRRRGTMTSSEEKKLRDDILTFFRRPNKRGGLGRPLPRAASLRKY